MAGTNNILDYINAGGTAAGNVLSALNGGKTNQPATTPAPARTTTQASWVMPAAIGGGILVVILVIVAVVKK